MSPSEPTKPSRFPRIRHFQETVAVKFGIDAKVFSGLLNRFATMALGPVGSAIIVLKLDIETQGIYYLFLSILALRSFFELGVGMSITQIAAHSKLYTGGKAFVHASSVIAASRWMRSAALLFGFLVGTGGCVFLASKGYGGMLFMSAWSLFIVVSSLQFTMEGHWALLQGADYVKECNHLRLVFQLTLYSIQWTLLLLGCGLFSFAISSFIIYLTQRILLRRKFPWLFPTPDSSEPGEISRQKNALITLVTRSSQTFMTGFFVYEIQQPICFHFLGAPGSARMGFTQVVGMALITLPTIWVQSAFPAIAAHVAEGSVGKAWEQFRTAWLRTSILTLGCWLGALLVIEILRRFPGFQDRLLQRGDAAIFYAGLAIQSIALSMTYWPRAFKVEPFVAIAYTQMIATPLLLWFLIGKMGMTGMAVAVLGTWLVGLAGISMTCRRFLPLSR